MCYSHIPLPIQSPLSSIKAECISSASCELPKQNAPIFCLPGQMLLRPAFLYRKAHRRIAKHLIELAHDEAAARCSQEHQSRRLLLTRKLDAIKVFCRSNPVRLAAFRELVLAALACAREEILWHFLHVDEVQCSLAELTTAPFVLPRYCRCLATLMLCFHCFPLHLRWYKSRFSA